MPKCGVCGGHLGRTMTPHGAICEDDRKAPPMPTISDLIRQQEEEKANG